MNQSELLGYSVTTIELQIIFIRFFIGATISMKIFICLIEFCFLLSGRWEVGLWDWGLCNLWRDEVIITMLSVIMSFIFFISLMLGSSTIYYIGVNTVNNVTYFLYCTLHCTFWVVRWRSSFVDGAYIGIMFRFW